VVEGGFGVGGRLRGEEESNGTASVVGEGRRTRSGERKAKGGTNVPER